MKHILKQNLSSLEAISKNTLIKFDKTKILPSLGAKLTEHYNQLTSASLKINSTKG